MKSPIVTPTYKEIFDHLHALSDSQIAQHSQRFFKTEKGEYGYGDIFLGIRVPTLRQVVKLFQMTSLQVAEQLLQSKYHEIRLFALLLLVYKFSHGNHTQRVKIYQLYISNTKYINNWDLVDSSAHHIVGAYLYNRDRSILLQLAKSNCLWQRRIAILATFYFIKKDLFTDTLEISAQLLGDKEDLMHKAVGWMLREVGKRDMNSELQFINTHYHNMPRTMLRYAIEKFDEELRLEYLHGTFTRIKT